MTDWENGRDRGREMHTTVKTACGCAGEWHSLQKATMSPCMLHSLSGFGNMMKDPDESRMKDGHDQQWRQPPVLLLKDLCVAEECACRLVGAASSSAMSIQNSYWTVQLAVTFSQCGQQQQLASPLFPSPPAPALPTRSFSRQL